MFEAIGSSNVLGCPETGVVIVVYAEEVIGVEAGYVMFLYYIVSRYLHCCALHRVEIVGKSIPAMCRVAQSASGGTSTGACSLPPCAEALSAHDSSKSALNGTCSMRIIFFRLAKLEKRE